MSVEQGIKYELQLGWPTTLAGDGTVDTLGHPLYERVVFNDPTDPDFVGYLREPPSGLDGVPIAESADELVEDDGGAHGSFYLQRRPITFTGFIPPLNQTVDNARADKLLHVGNMGLRPMAQPFFTPAGVDPYTVHPLDSDKFSPEIILTYTPTGGEKRRFVLRSQQPPRITDRRPKTFFAAFVAAQPYAESNQRYFSTTSVDTTVSSGGTMILPLNPGGRIHVRPLLHIMPFPSLSSIEIAWDDVAFAEGIRVVFPVPLASPFGLTVDFQRRTFTSDFAFENLYAGATQLAWPAEGFHPRNPDGQIRLRPAGGGVRSTPYADAGTAFSLTTCAVWRRRWIS